MDLTFDERVLMPPNALMQRLSAEISPPTDLLQPEVHRLLVFPATELEMISEEHLSELTLTPLLPATTRRRGGAAGSLQKPE